MTPKSYSSSVENDVITMTPKSYSSSVIERDSNDSKVLF